MFRSKWTDVRQKKGGLDLRGSITVQVLRYSSNPNPGSTIPNAAPHNGNGKPVTLDTDINASSFDSDLLDTLELDPADQTIQGFSMPGCPDKFGDIGSLAVASLIPLSIPASLAPAPPFPTSSCLHVAISGFEVDKAFAALDDFCSQTGRVKKGADPVSKVYDGGEGPGHELRIHFTLSWDIQAVGNDACLASQSPGQNEGRDCNTTFHDIVNGCKSFTCAHMSGLNNQ